MASRSALSPKSVQKTKETAIVDAEKRIRRFERLQRKAACFAEKEERRREKQRKKLMQPFNEDGSTIVQLSANVGLTNHNSGTGNRSTAGEQNQQPRFSQLVSSGSDKNNGMLGVSSIGGAAGLQLHSLINSVKDTLNGGSSARIVRSLGAVSRKVQSKKQRAELPTSITTVNEMISGNQSISNNPFGMIKTTTDVNATLRQKTRTGGKKSDSFQSLRSLAGIQRDADVLYVRRVGTLNCVPTKLSQSTTLADSLSKQVLSKCNYSQSMGDLMQLDSLDSNNNTNGSRSSHPSSGGGHATDSGIESEPGSRSGGTLEERKRQSKATSNESAPSKEKRNIFNRLRPALKELLGRNSGKRCNLSENKSAQGNPKSNKNRSRLIRAISEPDFMQTSYCLKPGAENGSHNELDDQLDSLRPVAPKANMYEKSSLFERPGFGSVAFRRNLYGQVWAANGRFTLGSETKEVRKKNSVDSIGNSNGSSSISSAGSGSANSSISTGSSGVHTVLTDDLQLKISNKTTKNRRPLTIVSSSSTSTPTSTNTSKKPILAKTHAKLQPVALKSSVETTHSIDKQEIDKKKVSSETKTIFKETIKKIKTTPETIKKEVPLIYTTTKTEASVPKIPIAIDKLSFTQTDLHEKETTASQFNEKDDDELCHWQHDVEREVTVERAPTAKCRHVCTIAVNTSELNSFKSKTIATNSEQIMCNNCSQQPCVCSLHDTCL